MISGLFSVKILFKTLSVYYSMLEQILNLKGQGSIWKIRLYFTEKL